MQNNITNILVNGFEFAQRAKDNIKNLDSLIDEAVEELKLAKKKSIETEEQYQEQWLATQNAKEAYLKHDAMIDFDTAVQKFLVQDVTEHKFLGFVFGRSVKNSIPVDEMTDHLIGLNEGFWKPIYLSTQVYIFDSLLPINGNTIPSFKSLRMHFRNRKIDLPNNDNYSNFYGIRSSLFSREEEMLYSEICRLEDLKEFFEQYSNIDHEELYISIGDYNKFIKKEESNV